MVTPGGNGDDVEQKAEFLNETFIGVHMIVLLFPAEGIIVHINSQKTHINYMKCSVATVDVTQRE